DELHFVSNGISHTAWFFPVCTSDDSHSNPSAQGPRHGRGADVVHRFQNSNHMCVIPGRGRRRRPRARNPVTTAECLLDSGLASASLRRPGMTSFMESVV